MTVYGKKLSFLKKKISQPAGFLKIEVYLISPLIKNDSNLIKKNIVYMLINCVLFY